MSVEQMEQQLQEAVEQARDVCSSQGDQSPECATAWDTVEEMQAEISHRRQKSPKSNFEQYCDDNPDASECRVYDV
jgi:uncharacterized protein YgiB involved in biofilm formation